jgi:hypothetical protein
MRLKLLFGFMLTGALFSCSKEIDPVPELNEPDPVAELNTYDFSFRFDSQITVAQDFELIISQQDGKILLDTLLATKTKHALQVKSTEPKWNVTAISGNPANNTYIIRTYLQIRPDNWDIVNNPRHPLSNQIASGVIQYNNIPDGRTIFSTQERRSFSTKIEDNTMTLNYTRLVPQDMAYLLSVSQSKYIFTQIESAQHQVDFSQAIAASKKTLELPAGISSYGSYLYGYPKAGDYSKQMLLFDSAPISNTDYDVLYPSTNIEEYDLTVGYLDQEGYAHSYTFLGKSVPSDIGFEAKPNFEVKSATLDEVQVAFGNNKPSTYTSFWIATDESLKGNWQVYAPSELTTFKPKAFLENLNSKLLKEKDLNLLKPSTVTTYNAKDATHQSLLDYWANPEAVLNREIKQWQIIRYSVK